MKIQKFTVSRFVASLLHFCPPLMFIMFMFLHEVKQHEKQSIVGELKILDVINTNIIINLEVEQFPILSNFESIYSAKCRCVMVSLILKFIYVIKLFLMLRSI